LIETERKQALLDEQIAQANQAEESAKAIEAVIAINKLCHAIGRKLGSVSIEDCEREPLIHSEYSTEGRSIAYREYLPIEGHQNLGKVLVLGGIHGDELSSVSVVFKWLKILDQFHNGLFHWRIVPTVNPDGLLRSKSQRQNSNGIDLNRNFPTADWSKNAIAYWEHKTQYNPRRNPGSAPASEVETQWIVNQIDSFQPDVIISMHAPYHLVDYDGPPTAPENLGSLYLRKLGVYPGSLGNYVGIDKNKPIVTVELKSAGIMPRQTEIDTMWNDLVRWLSEQLQPDQAITERLSEQD
jgi:protein MpaA